MRCPMIYRKRRTRSRSNATDTASAADIIIPVLFLSTEVNQKRREAYLFDLKQGRKVKSKIMTMSFYQPDEKKACEKAQW